jgi:hypothetical protein
MHPIWTVWSVGSRTKAKSSAGSWPLASTGSSPFPSAGPSSPS